MVRTYMLQGFVVETPTGNVAFFIALGILLLSVVLQPIVRTCVYRIRAARAWNSIQNNEAVDITKVRSRFPSRKFYNGVECMASRVTDQRGEANRRDAR